MNFEKAHEKDSGAYMCMSLRGDSVLKGPITELKIIGEWNLFVPLFARISDDSKNKIPLITSSHKIWSHVFRFLWVFISLIDPNPYMTISDTTISIEENTILNPVVTWVKVVAYNLQTQERAKVKFDIIEGNTYRFPDMKWIYGSMHRSR